MARLVTIANFDRTGPAYVLKLYLEDAGFTPFISNENMIGVDYLGAVKIQVPEQEAEAAAKFVSKFDERDSNVGEADIHFRCSECGRAISFPARRRGGVETCPFCHEYVDVPE